MDEELKNKIEREEADDYLNKKTVNINFRVPANMKLELQRRASLNNQNLSELLELICLNYFEGLSQDKKKINNYEIQQELTGVKGQIEELKTNIDFYEKNNKMLRFFDSTKNKTVKFRDSEGKAQEITVKTIKDVYTIVILNTKNE